MAEANELDWNNQFLHWVGWHCVAVGWEDSEVGAECATGGFVFSGFIMSIQDLWFLVTAGHIIDDINARLDGGRQFRYAKIVDRWSEENVDGNPIPFPDIIDQKRVPQGHLYDEHLGIDYGWFYLRDYYRNLLVANGMVALDEAAWKNVPEDLQSYNVFGFPRDCVAEYRDENKRYRGLRIKAQLVPYRRES
jgi:hypothetical protein